MGVGNYRGRITCPTFIKEQGPVWTIDELKKAFPSILEAEQLNYGDIDDDDVKKIASALAAIPNRPPVSGTEWRNIIFALKHAHDNATTPEIAARIKELGFAWSDSAKDCQGSKPDHNNKQRDRIWNSASSNHDKLIGIGTLFYYAKERGWTPPASDLTQWFDELDNDGAKGTDNNDGGCGNSAGEWQEPKPLPDGLSPVVSFECGFLPASIGPWVEDISERLQCPPDYVGIPAMVALGSIIGRKIGIRPQAKTDWIEVPNLWGAITGPPGSLKSPAMEEVLKPIKRLDIKANQQFAIAMKEHERQLEKYEVAKAKAKKQALKDLASENDNSEKPEGNYPPPFLGRRYLGRQAKVSRMVWKGFAPLSLAVSTVVLTSASAFAAHMAR